MAGFANFDQLIEALTVDGQVNEATFSKQGTAVEAAGVWHSFWKAPGLPAAGADPATTPGTAYDLTDGGLTKWADVEGAGDTRHLLSLEAQATIACTLMLYDRLVGVSGISTASTGDKTISSTALPRYTDGVGVQAWLEVTTQTATNVATVSMNSYTDHAGNTGQVGGSVTFPAAATNVDTLIGPFPLAAGDYGVRACSTINVATASTGGGVVNFLLIKPLAFLPILGGLGAAVDFVSMIPSLPRLYDGHTLGLAMLSTTTTGNNIWGQIKAAYR